MLPIQFGPLQCVTLNSLGTKLTTIGLHKHWNKTVTAFVNHVAHLIKDHKDLSDNMHQDSYYIEKLNATFDEHRDMSQHIQKLKTQEDILQRRLGTAFAKNTYNSQLF